MKKKKITFKPKNKKFIFILICIGISLIGLCFLWIATETTEFIPFKEGYEFKIFVEEKYNDTYIEPDLEYFTLYYDFDNNLGEISFKIDEHDLDINEPIKHKISEIELTFPGIVDNNSVEVYIKGCDQMSSCRKFNYSRRIYPMVKTSTHTANEDDYNYTHSRIRILSSKNNEIITYNELIEVKFNLLDKIYPKGEFEIWYDNNIRNGKAIFDLGKGYDCYQQCILYSSHVELLPKGEEGEDNTIKFKLLTDRFHNTPHFEINAVSKGKEINRNFFMSLGVSIIVASIMFILQILYSWSNINK